jgi:hypothetical protein
MDKLFKNTLGWRGGAIGNGVAHGVPAAVEMQAVAAVECTSVLLS